MGPVNIKAVITLRNPPKKIKAQFQLTTTVTVLPRAVSPCNSIILKRNSSIPLLGQFQPETNVDSLGQIYALKHDYSGVQGTVFVEDKKLKVASDARSGQNVVVTLVLQSPEHDDRYAHKVKQYPLNQASSLTVSIVEPTGLNLIDSPYGGVLMMENAVYTQSVKNIMGSNDQPFWTSLSSAQTVRSVEYSRTENILCEKQSVLVKIAILDELARELHAMEQCKAVSNDTTIVDARKEIKIGTDRVGGAMYASVQLDALQPGYATITFQGEKDPQSENGVQSTQSKGDYVMDDPNFLRTFLTIRVLSTAECEAQFGVHFVDFGGSAKNESTRTQPRKEKLKERNQMRSTPTTTTAVPTEPEQGWWMRYKLTITMVLVTALTLIVCCGWNACGTSNALTMATVNDRQHHAAQFDPLRQLSRSGLGGLNNNPYSQQQSSYYM